MEQTWKDKLFNWKTLGSFCLAFFILFLIVTQADLPQLLQIFSSIKWQFFLIALLIFVVDLIFRAVRWHILLRNIKTKVTFRDTLEYLVLLMFTNSAIPAKLGNLYAPYLIKKNHKQPVFKTLGTIVVDRFFDLLVMGLLLTLVILLGSFGEHYAYYLFLLKICYLLLIILFAFIFLMRNQLPLLIRFVPKKFQSMTNNLSSSIKECLPLSSVPGFGVALIIFWVLLILRYYFIFLALGIQIPTLTLFFIILVGILAQLFPFTPSGLGLVEAGTIGAFILLGVEKNLAISAALLERFFGYWLMIFIGFIVFIKSKKT